MTQLAPEARQEVVERTIKIINATQVDQAIQGMREYFHYMLHKLAQVAAIYQAIGFTQDSLHLGQITLAGKVCDVGIGSFGSIRDYGVVNSLHPWFRHERQPLLLQNMAFKSHSVKSEPRAVQLLATSKTFQRQQSLFGFIRSFDEQAASQILKDNPPTMFWNLYSEYYRRFDSRTFYHEQLARVSDFFDSSYGFYISMSYENVYIAMLTTRIVVREVIIGEMIWVALKGAFMSMGVGIVLGLSCKSSDLI